MAWRLNRRPVPGPGRGLAWALLGLTIAVLAGNVALVLAGVAWRSPCR